VDIGGLDTTNVSINQPIIFQFSGLADLESVLDEHVEAIKNLGRANKLIFAISNGLENASWSSLPAWMQRISKSTHIELAYKVGGTLDGDTLTAFSTDSTLDPLAVLNGQLLASYHDGYAASLAACDISQDTSTDGSRITDISDCTNFLETSIAFIEEEEEEEETHVRNDKTQRLATGQHERYNGNTPLLLSDDLLLSDNANLAGTLSDKINGSPHAGCLYKYADKLRSIYYISPAAFNALNNNPAVLHGGLCHHDLPEGYLFKIYINTDADAEPEPCLVLDYDGQSKENKDVFTQDNFPLLAIEHRTPGERTYILDSFGQPYHLDGQPVTYQLLCELFVSCQDKNQAVATLCGIFDCAFPDDLECLVEADNFCKAICYTAVKYGQKGLGTFLANVNQIQDSCFDDHSQLSDIFRFSASTDFDCLVDPQIKKYMLTANDNDLHMLNIIICFGAAFATIANYLTFKDELTRRSLSFNISSVQDDDGSIRAYTSLMLSGLFASGSTFLARMLYSLDAVSNPQEALDAITRGDITAEFLYAAVREGVRYYHPLLTFLPIVQDSHQISESRDNQRAMYNFCVPHVGDLMHQEDSVGGIEYVGQAQRYDQLILSSMQDRVRSLGRQWYYLLSFAASNEGLSIANFEDYVLFAEKLSGVTQHHKLHYALSRLVIAGLRKTGLQQGRELRVLTSFFDDEVIKRGVCSDDCSEKLWELVEKWCEAGNGHQLPDLVELQALFSFIGKMEVKCRAGSVVLNSLICAAGNDVKCMKLIFRTLRYINYSKEDCWSYWQHILSMLPLGDDERVDSYTIAMFPVTTVFNRPDQQQLDLRNDDLKTLCTRLESLSHEQRALLDKAIDNIDLEHSELGDGIDLGSIICHIDNEVSPEAALLIVHPNFKYISASPTVVTFAEVRACLQAAFDGDVLQGISDHAAIFSGFINSELLNSLLNDKNGTDAVKPQQLIEVLQLCSNPLLTSIYPEQLSKAAYRVINLLLRVKPIQSEHPDNETDQSGETRQGKDNAVSQYLVKNMDALKGLDQERLVAAISSLQNEQTRKAITLFQELWQEGVEQEQDVPFTLYINLAANNFKYDVSTLPEVRLKKFIAIIKNYRGEKPDLFYQNMAGMLSSQQAVNGETKNFCERYKPQNRANRLFILALMNCANKFNVEDFANLIKLGVNCPELFKVVAADAAKDNKLQELHVQLWELQEDSKVLANILLLASKLECLEVVGELFENHTTIDSKILAIVEALLKDADETDEGNVAFLQEVVGSLKHNATYIETITPWFEHKPRPNIEQLKGMFEREDIVFDETRAVGSPPRSEQQDNIEAIERLVEGVVEPIYGRSLGFNIKDKLISLLKFFNSNTCDYSVLSRDKIKEQLKTKRDDISSDSSSLDGKNQAMVRYLALSREVLWRTTGKWANSAQLLSVLLHAFGNQNIATENKTGEGKTIIAALVSALNVAQNIKTDMATSDMDLARDNLASISDFYKYLGINAGLADAATEFTDYAELDVCYTDCTQLSLFKLRQKNAGILDGESRALVMDEFDAALILHATEQNNLALRVGDGTNNPLRNIYPKINDFVDRYDGIASLPSDAIAQLRTSLNSIKGDDEKLNSDIEIFLNLSDERIFKYICTALAVKDFAQKKDAAFMVGTIADEFGNEKSIAYLVAPGGNLAKKSRLGNGGHQLLHARLESSSDNMPSFVCEPENEIIDTLLAEGLLSFYRKVNCVSGTVGDQLDVEFLSTPLSANLQILKVPPFYPSQRVDAGAHFYPEERPYYFFGYNHLDAIAEQRKISYDNDMQPMLIICQTAAAATTLRSKMRESGYRIQLLLPDASESGKKDILANAGQEAFITISTTMIGRGTDIKCEHPHGLAVVDTRNCNDINTQQGFGRSGRYGHVGRAVSIPLASDNIDAINHDTIRRANYRSAVKNYYSNKINAARAECIKEAEQDFAKDTDFRRAKVDLLSKFGEICTTLGAEEFATSAQDSATAIINNYRANLGLSRLNDDDLRYVVVKGDGCTRPFDLDISFSALTDLRCSMPSYGVSMSTALNVILMQAARIAFDFTIVSYVVYVCSWLFSSPTVFDEVKGLHRFFYTSSAVQDVNKISALTDKIEESLLADINYDKTRYFSAGNQASIYRKTMIEMQNILFESVSNNPNNPNDFYHQVKKQLDMIVNALSIQGIAVELTITADYDSLQAAVQELQDKKSSLPDEIGTMLDNISYHLADVVIKKVPESAFAALHFAPKNPAVGAGRRDSVESGGELDSRDSDGCEDILGGAPDSQCL